jgi:hypothetical protein
MRIDEDFFGLNAFLCCVFWCETRSDLLIVMKQELDVIVVIADVNILVE